MSPSNNKLLPNCKSTSCIQNTNGKRSFLITLENDVTDNDIYYKKKKSTKHSQIDINNAVLTAPNGYMTRNKLKKQLTNNCDLIETSVIENKCSGIDNIRNKSKTIKKKNRKLSSKIYKNKLQLGYVFTNDIFSYPGKRLDTEYKKSLPSLFESDSDPEIDDFPLKDNIKNEVQEISTYISYPDNVYPTFDKNVEMRTYFNKKTYHINNKSNIKSLNTLEESNQEPSRLSNKVKTVHDSNLCKSISQSDIKTNELLKVTGPITNKYEQTYTEDDGIIIVTESFIRQLKNEFQIIKTESQGEIRTQDILYNKNTDKSNNSDIEQHKDNEVVSNVLSSDYKENQINMCTIDTNIDDIYDINFKSSICSDLLIKQNIDVINKPDEFTPSSFKTTNIVENDLMSIFDEPNENVLSLSCTNINDNIINYSDSNSLATISEKIMELSSLQTFEFDNSNSDQSIENHPMSDKNISCHIPSDQIESNIVTNQYFHTVIKDEIKIKPDSFSSKRNYDCLLKNDNLSSTKDNYSKKSNNHHSKCYCKNFCSFKNDDNKIFTSKVKHFAFNNNAKNVRQKILRKKYLEANILKMLITKEHKNIIQSRECVPIFNSISINKKYEKCNNLKENDHIEPSILSMLKDVYVDVEYLTEYCDFNTNDNKLPELQNNNKDIKIDIQASKVKPIDNMCKFKNNNDSISDNTTQNKPISLDPCNKKYDNFNKNEIIDNASISNSATKNFPIYFKPCNENDVNFNKNKLIDNVSMSNTITEKPVNFKSYDESYINFNKNKTIDNISTSNSNPNDLESCDQSDIHFNKNKMLDNVSTSNNTKQDKPINLKFYEKSDINFNKYKIIDNTSISNYMTKNKLINPKSCNQSYTQFNKNKINYPTIDSIKKYDSDCDSVCNSRVINAEIDTKNKIKVEDNINYDTTDIKINFKTEKCPRLEIKPFDIGHLSDSTIITNKNNDSKKEFKMAKVKYNDIESENILSSAKIKINHGFTQTKITHILKNEQQPVPAIIGSEEETSVSKLFEPPQYNNLFDTSDTISSNAYQICPIMPYISENNEFVNNLFDLPDNIAFSLNNSSSDNDDDDDDNRLLIEDAEPNIDGSINKNSTYILNLDNSSKDERIINYSSSSASIINFTPEIKFCEKKLINPKKKQSTKINIIKNEKVLNPILPEKKCDLSNNNWENAHLLKEEKNSLDDCMSIEMCNEFYKIKSLNKNINKNESLPKNIKDILKEMYVDELFVSSCQHMVDIYYDNDQTKNDLFFQTNESRNMLSEKLVSDIVNENVEKKIYSEINQPIPTNMKTCKTEINCINQETNKPSNTITKEKKSFSLQKPNELRKLISTKQETISKSEINNHNQQKNHINPTITTQKFNSLQKPKNVKSNMKIRIHLREFILSKKPLNEILESKEFRNLRFFSEEEIANSIGVFIFEQIIHTPIITGLSVYKENYDHLKNEEKNKILASTNLSIICPEIMMLTSVTLALVKMLRSDSLIEVILNVIRKNVLKKLMNTDHSIDNQLIKQTVYFVDICVRLRLLKTLQIFIFDSMVILPNKYCCIIFISLLLWKNCLPRSINNEEDPVIITVMSCLIAKKKLYSEETVGCDIFQRELINLLSCYFNYSFSIDMPTNFIQHMHKPDFFVSVVMFLKCCNPKDLVEFMVNCLFPIVENYLNTQQNEMYAIQIMESINMAIKPFKITCNTTVATYLNKCKDPINGFKKNGKEHIYSTIFNSYKILQNKFIEYLNDSRPRSQYFEELLITIILVLGSVDYLTSCMSLMQWKPKFELSATLSKKIVMFKSIIGHNLWDKLCTIDDIKTKKCLVNSCLINKDVYDTIIQLHNLR